MVATTARSVRATHAPARAMARPAAALAVLLCIAVALIGPLAGRASAHASLVGTDPSPDTTLDDSPSTVSVTFDEPVSVDLAGIRIYGPDGERVEQGSSRLVDGGRTVSVGLEPGRQGTYTVAWTVVSADSHVLTGSFVFHVGERTGAAFVPDDRGPTIDVVGWAARWIGMSGAIVAVGVAVYALVFRTPGRGLQRLCTVATIAAAAAFAGAVVRFVVQVADTSGRTFPSVLRLLDDAIAQTRVGRIDLVRIDLAVAALVATRWWPRRGAIAAVGVFAAAALVCNSISGHAWSVDHQTLAVVVDIVHQLASAVWIGGLVALVVTQLPKPDPGVLRRFTALVGGALAAIVLTGLVSSWLQVRTRDALTDTTYGRTVLAKVALVAVTALAGATVSSRLRKETARPPVRLLGVELLFALAVLATTAGLVDAVPGREYRSGPYGVNLRDELGPVSVTVDPAALGENALHLYFFDESGAPRAVDVAEARVATGDLPPRKIDLYALAPGHYTAIDVSLPVRGTWQFTITTLSEGRPATLQFEVPIK